MKNPTRALAAFTAPPSVKVGPYEVREITLGLAGVLEAVESPVFTGVKPREIGGWGPTLYAMTRSTEESERLLAAGGADAYARAAKAWIDTVPLAVGTRLVEAVTASVDRLNGIEAEDDGASEGGAEGNDLAAGRTGG